MRILARENLRIIRMSWAVMLLLLLSVCRIQVTEAGDIHPNDPHHHHHHANTSLTHLITNRDAAPNHPDASAPLTYTKLAPHYHRRVPVMFSRPATTGNASGSGLLLCTESIWEFPEFFTQEQLKNGALVMAFVVGLYCFMLIAIICDSYFLPCVERICDTFKISQDVAAAVFLSMATSTPELFTNVIGTFVTESDIGLGAIVGSSMFNTLGVAALGSLAAAKPIKLDWWPLCRDVVIYITAILMLVTMTWDGIVYWWEACILSVVYVIYFIVMFQNQRISNFFRRTCTRRAKQLLALIGIDIEKRPTPPVTAIETPDAPISIIGQYSVHQQQHPNERKISFCSKDCKEVEVRNAEVVQTEEDTDKEQVPESLFKCPTGIWYSKCWFFFLWPIKIVLYYTIPNPEKYPRLFPATFVMCIVWMAITSYLVSWMVTVIGYTLGIPDSILGLTFLAAGGCLPEAISLTIMSRKGEGSMGVSNALGANTMNILLSLGVPWFIKAAFVSPGHIQIESGSIEYTIMALILAAILLFITLAWNKFRLSKRTGIVLGLTYILFIVLAVLSELVFFERRGCIDA